MAFIRQIVNGETLNIFQLEGAVTIGRSAECNIVVDDPTISGVHASIEARMDGVYLVDQNSTNGCMVQGQKVAEHKMQPGTFFRVGTCEFEFLERVPSELEQTLEIKKSWIPGVYYTAKPKDEK